MRLKNIFQLLLMSGLMVGTLVGSHASIQRADACPMRRSEPLLVKRQNTGRMLRVAQRAFHNQEYASAYSAYRKVWRKLHGDAQAEALHNMAISAQEAGIKSGALTAARFLVRAQPSNGMGYVMLAAALEGRTDNAGAQERKWASAKARRLGEVIDEGNESDIFVAGL